MIERLASLYILNSLWQAPLVCLAAWFATRLLGKPGAESRYTIFFVALVISAVLPLVTLPHRLGDVAAPTLVRAFTIAWAACAFIPLAGIARRVLLVNRLKRTALPADLDLRNSLPRWNTHRSRLRDLRICVSDVVDSPQAVGLFDAMVVLPSWLVRSDRTALDAFSLHEVAHLMRWDDWTKLIQDVAVAIMVLNPAFHWLRMHLNLEREIACDDFAAQGVERPKYADALIQYARAVAWTHNASFVPSLFNGRSSISRRVEHLLQSEGTGDARFLQVTPFFALMAVVIPLCVALTPLATAAVTLPLDDPRFNARANTLVSHLEHGHLPSQRWTVVQRTIQAMGDVSSLVATARVARLERTSITYALALTRGQGQLVVSFDKSGAIVGYTFSAIGTSRAGVPLSAYLSENAQNILPHFQE